MAKTNYNENENENVQKIIIKSEESCSLILMAFTMAIILEKVSFSWYFIKNKNTCRSWCKASGKNVHCTAPVAAQHIFTLKLWLSQFTCNLLGMWIMQIHVWEPFFRCAFITIVRRWIRGMEKAYSILWSATEKWFRDLTHLVRSS